MIEGFGQEVQQVWDTGILGTNLGEIFFAVGIFLVFLFARRLFFSDHDQITQIDGQENRDHN